MPPYCPQTSLGSLHWFPVSSMNSSPSVYVEAIDYSFQKAKALYTTSDEYSLLGKVLKKVVVVLHQTRKLVAWMHSWLASGLVMVLKLPLVALVDDMSRERDGGSVTLFVVFDLSGAFSTVDSGILECLREVRGGGHSVSEVLLILLGLFPKCSYERLLFSTMGVVLTWFHLVPLGIKHIYEAAGSCHQGIRSEVLSICN